MTKGAACIILLLTIFTGGFVILIIWDVGFGTLVAACIDEEGCNCWYAILGIVQLILIQLYGIGYVWSLLTSIMIMCRAY